MIITDLGRFRIKDIEKEVKKYWSTNEIPAKWRSINKERPTYSFLEGPPTANGFPHIGHLRGRIYKDMVLKYYRLKGFNVWAQAGWDEQGLPVEVEVEKKLGIKHKKEIGEKIGFDEFVRKCNELVDYYLSFWRKYATEEIGLWLDLENAYETRKAWYINHVWHFIKEAYEKGLIYEGYRVLPYCPRCETALSDAEVDQGYQEKISPSIYVKFKVEGERGTYLIIWTTTPWTIVDNEAVAVNPEGTYCKVRVGDEYWWIAENRVKEVMDLSGVKEWSCVERVKGSTLEGLRYEHPLMNEVPIHKTHKNAHYVVLAEYVSLDEGTGLVHTAPGHGPEDYETGVKYGLPITSNVEINGVFNEKGGVFKGLYVDEASRKVIEILKNKRLLVHEGTIKHQYPHCWRCHTPLIYRAGRQWFLKVTAVKEKLLQELSKVNIYPTKLRARFDNWVANAKDWTISRSRIWGTPLPIWKCRSDPKKVLVIGSLDELKNYAAFLPKVKDDELVHRPWIDEVKIVTDDCQEWVREPFVVDVWIDSGMAWLASVNGLKNQEVWRKLFPYNFITEGIDQTRGWFYSLLVTSVILTGQAPYKDILMQGLVLDKYGRKMTKHLGNVVWGKDAIERYGVDQLRLYILSSYPPGEPFIFNLEELKEPLSKLNIIWNVYRFANTYMELDKFNPEVHDLKELIKNAKKEDLWIISRVNTVQKEVDEYMKHYDLHLATRAVINFFIEDLSHNYLRLVRPRVWREEGDDKYVVYAALYYTLKKGLQMLSPITPHFAEALWLRFIKKFEPKEAESIHLSRLADVEADLINTRLEKVFNEVFRASSFIASLRNAAGIKLRWPLKVAYLKVSDKEIKSMLEEGVETLKFLTNIKHLEIVEELPAECKSKEFLTMSNEAIEGCIPSRLDKDTYMEALAREIIRRIQVMRNEADLRVDEFIEVWIKTNDEDIVKSIERLRDYIMNEVRARKLAIGKIGSKGLIKEWDVEGKKITIGIQRAGQDAAG